MLTNKQVIAAKKAYLAWGGCLYVCGPNDHPPASYFKFCEAAKLRRELKEVKDNTALLKKSLELINKNRGGG